jgi:hypothetical protein
MPKWEKVNSFAGGIIYACGNLHKMVTNRNPQVYYYEVNPDGILWYHGNPGRQKNHKQGGLQPAV